MPVFEVVVVQSELTIQGEIKEHEKVFLGPVTIAARDANAAAHRVLKENANKLEDLDDNRMEVLTRPFL